MAGAVVAMAERRTRATRRLAPRGRVPPRRLGTLVALVLLPAVLVSGSTPLGANPPRPGPPHDVDWNAGLHARADPDTLAVGVTHTQYSVDPWGDAAALTRARAVLAATASYQNQHIFGWGGLNPEPSPGIYDWSALDRRMELIRSTGGIPVITLCCAPDWMKGGRPGETDWDRLEEAPLPEHYRDFAALAAAVARRYPDVRHFQVWNELKGFWSDALNRWDHEAYTRLYNEVYDALKAVDPDLKVGGPYVVFDTWHDPGAGGHASSLAGACGVVDQRGLDALEYWLKHKHGADFVTVDASLATRDHGLVTQAATAVQVFDALTRWIRQRTSLPVWWSEFHVGGGTPDQQPWLTAAAVATLLRMAAAGASVALIWQPQDEHEDERGGREPGAPRLWTSTERPGGGEPLPYATAVARAQLVLADGAGPAWVSWPRPDVGLLRGHRTLLLVHLGGGDVTVEVDGRPLRLGPHEVRYLVVPPRPLGARVLTALRGMADILVPRPSETSRCLRVTRDPVPQAAPSTPTRRMT
jgi:Glycosyl hydrolases family 39